MEELTVSQVQFYGVGLMRWVESGEISMGDLLKDKKAYRLLACLVKDPRKKDINSNFNGMPFEELSRHLNMRNLRNEP